MNALTQLAMFMLLLAGVLVAPHLTWPEARNFALISIVMALLFGGVGMSIK